jgi:hypothetical protein
MESNIEIKPLDSNLSEDLKNYLEFLEYCKKEFEKGLIELFCVPLKYHGNNDL